ncbi:MAG: alpha/beta hydrolase [Spirochaetales bacterium]|nr:alpha/beta hydrolase [Spirochaetales bacterium]
MEKDTKRKSGRALGALLLLIILTVAAELIAHGAMTGFGKVAVSNVWITNINGLKIRGKLFVPQGADERNPAPGVVYLHGYQNNRETSDPYAIELARRGFVVLNIDTLGRGNSDNQFSEDQEGFDATYGGGSAFAYLRSLSMVDKDRCGMAGHSLGAEMSYLHALENPSVGALVISGFAYRADATMENPKNMMMIFGKYDEYRDRMTGVRDLESQWMSSPQTRAAFPVENPEFYKTYGRFEDGTARKVYMTKTTHVGESFDPGALGAALDWFAQAFDHSFDLPVQRQVWRIKELCSLIAMLAAVASLFPLGLLLLRSRFFRSLSGNPGTAYTCSRRDFNRGAVINGILELLYLPLILVIFGFHVYVLPIDRAFPMMMINGIVFWFVVINLIGFAVFKGWMRKNRVLRPEITCTELGIAAKKQLIGKSVLLAVILFAYIYLLQASLERLLLIDFRYKFPYASDLTAFRFLMFLEYFVLFLLGYLQLNIFLMGQLRPAPRPSFAGRVFRHALRGALTVIIPLLVLMAAQYLPLFLTGVVPFVGPGGALVGFVINLEHMCVLLGMMVPLATFLYHSTGSIYPGAVLNALLVSWMFTSSSVIAPLPI